MDKYSEDGVQNIWDQTSLQAATCLQYYKYTKIDKWRPARKSEALEFGIFAHTAYEEYDKTIADGGSVDDAVDVTVKFALENGEHLNKFDNAQLQLPSLVRDVVWYGEQFRDDIFPLAMDEHGKPLIEIRFEVPIPGTNKRFSGRIDKVVWENDELIVVDRKFTKTTLNNYYFDAFKPSLQLTAYTWACRRVLGLPVSKVMIEAHQVGSTMNRCERRGFFVPDDRIDDFEKELANEVLKVDRAHETGEWFRDLRVCHNYGGCIFRNICASSKKHEAFLLGEFFVKE